MRHMTPFLTITAVLSVACAAGAEYSDNEVMPHDAFSRQSAGSAIIVDVRTSREYEAAHVEGAVNIPFDEVSERIEELRQLVGERDVILYCRSGRRAGIAESLLRDEGVINIYHLNGQIAGWASEGLPIATG